MYKNFRGQLTLQRNPVHLLRTQYRMHPEICSFPSKHFYNNKLKTSLPEPTKRKYDSFPFRPYLLFDIIEDGERSTDKDIINKAECQMVSALVSLLVAIEKFRIGIITLCEQHKILLNEKIKRLTNTNESIGQNVEISTVDGFQGHEKDVIILFCVRARGSGIGFVY
ncbi:probable helicase senataxin [Anneissia japonica]|uniref:probable helicase senataxin n=1 Tax=Anneissia japonica TaxID=1529436 RepID=UPI001425A1BC|nr:probable helicase senataxin [Anneissia japonica]